MPQIFSRLDKYTGEMQLGDTTEVTSPPAVSVQLSSAVAKFSLPL
jgi:hypothetical protein